jgi:phosphate-selective porin OprO/OprP
MRHTGHERGMPLLVALAVLVAGVARGGEHQAGPPAPRAETTVTVGSTGVGIRSEDGDYEARLRGYVHLDGRFFPGDDAAASVDTFLLRRVRPILQGTLARHFSFRIMPDFGRGTVELLDAYVDVDYSRKARVRLGKFKSPLGLERLQTRTALPVVELSYPTFVVPNRDIGILIEGDLGGGVVSYAAAILNGAPDGGSSDVDTNDGKDVAGRVFVSPWTRGQGPLRGLGLGIAGSRGEQSGPLPSYRSAGQVSIISLLAGIEADGTRTRVVPQGSFYAGPVGLLSEYARSESWVKNKDGIRWKLRAEAWQATVTVALTGEKESFDGLRPARPFDPGKGQWGAFELAARVEGLELGREAVDAAIVDPAKSVRKARSWTAALTWHLNRNVKEVVDYTRTTFTGGAPEGGDRPAENALFFRTQLSF